MRGGSRRYPGYSESHGEYLLAEAMKYTPVGVFEPSAKKAPARDAYHSDQASRQRFCLFCVFFVLCFCLFVCFVLSVM